MNILFIIAAIVRLSSVLFVQTSYVPDETWQCTEVAHKLVFGYGHLTWEWREGLRSYLHPLIFAFLFNILKALDIDSPVMVIEAPRVFQALLTLVGDIMLYRLVCRVYSRTHAVYALIANLSSWYMYYVSPRPLINNIETLLVTVTLNFWPIRYSDQLSYTALFLAALSVALRPTLVIFWAILGIHYIIHIHYADKYITTPILKAVCVGSITLMLAFELDSYFYEKNVFIFWNFLQFNLSQSGLYGAHPWHWYISQGLPALLGTHMFFIAISFLKNRDFPRQLLWVVGLTIIFFSIISHKEFRFIQHLMPIFMIWSALGMHWLGRKLSKPNFYLLIMIHMLLNLLPALYLSLFHQRGTISVMSDISHHTTSGNTVQFLTPCHATPYHSYLHRNDIKLSFLDCSPNLNSSLNYIHEEGEFYSDPVRWWGVHGGADVVVMFDGVLERLVVVLEREGYKVVSRYFHAHLLLDENVGEHILLLKKNF